MLKIGIIGAGMIAEKHADSFQQLGKTELTWIADIDEVKAGAFKDKYSIANATKDYKEILADKDVHIVVIATPPWLHKQMFLDSLEAKKHILLEKPMAIKTEELDEMIKAKQKHPDLVVSDCSARHTRLQPKFRKAKEVIDSGKLGDIYYIHHNSIWRQARAGIEYHPEAKWFLNKAIAGGGQLLDWGVYDLAFHLGLLSDKPELEKVKAFFTKTKLDDVDPGTDIYDVEEQFVAMLEFSNGLSYYWERGSNAHMEIDNETRIYGTKGGIRLAYCSWDPNTIEFFDVDNNGKGKARKEVIEVDMEGHSDELAMAEHFIDAVENKKEVILPLELAKKHLDIIFKIYEEEK